jgi:ubiquinone/menaquinone biosynthesis C-methylase UbiE
VRQLSSRWLFDAGAGAYRWVTDQPAWRGSCASLVTRLPPGRSIRVLDLGCGPGNSTAGQAALRPDIRLIGLDLSRRMLVGARRAGSRSSWGAHVTWVQADATRLPLRTASIDAVTGHSFLYLVPDRDAVLAETLRIVRPGGRLILMEPNARRATIRSVLGVSHDPRHVIATALWRPFSRLHGRHDAASLAAAMERAGFVGCVVEETLGGLGLLAWGERP